MSFNNISIPLEIEEPDTTIPKFNSLNEVYEMELVSLYAAKKRAYQLFALVNKQILEKEEIQPRVLNRLYAVMDDFEENKRTSMSNIKAMTDFAKDNIDKVDKRMLSKCKAKIKSMEEQSSDLITKGESLTSVLFKQQQSAPADHSVTSTPRPTRSPHKAYKASTALNRR